MTDFRESMIPPGQGSDGDKTGNDPAGTTIDRDLGHPVENDYYQLTHGGLLGLAGHLIIQREDIYFAIILTRLFNYVGHS